ncbi:MAG: L,D-transpeptidase family protein [Candidatus Omnitrophota bacterium]
MNKRVIIAAVIIVVVGAIIFGVTSRLKGSGITGIFSQSASLYNQAASLQAKGQIAEATSLLEELVAKFPQENNTADALSKLGAIYEGDGQWLKAKESYGMLIATFPNSKNVSEAEKRLWDMNIKILFSPLVTEKDFAYLVVAGDSLAKIATKQNTTVDLIMRSNNVQGTLIRVGQRLKIPANKFSVIIDKSQNTLALKADDEIMKVYSVATGKDNCTPLGNFTIIERLINPDWYKSGQGVVPADSPENILGTRWMGLSEPQYGIHGGATPPDLGQQVTEGCVRMLDADVEELFTILPRNTVVTIVD